MRILGESIIPHCSSYPTRTPLCLCPSGKKKTWRCDCVIWGSVRGSLTFRIVSRLWSDLEASGKSMVDGCNIAVFTKGIKPTWEASQAHGKWVMLTDKRETMSKLMLVLQAVMECTHPNLAHVCGVVLSVRPTRDCIAIWNTKGGDSHFIKATRNSLVHAAGLAPSQKLNYFIIRTGGAGASPPSQAAKANGGSSSNKGGSVSLPPSLPSSQTEGGGLRRTLRPKTGIETDVESLERLRKAMARASPGARPLWGGNREDVGGGLKVHEVRAEEREWSPYGTNVEQQQQAHEDETGMQGWRATAAASAAEGLTWPPAGTSFSGVGPLLGGGAGYNAFSGRSIWAPGADAGAYDVDVSPGVARHIEAILASSPSTEGGDSPPSQDEVAGMGMFASYGGHAPDGGQGGDEAHSLMLSAVPSVGSVGSSWGPSPAVGKNPGFFQAHALSPAEVKTAHAEEGLETRGAEAKDEDADVSGEDEDEDEMEATAQEEEKEGGGEEVRGQWAVDESGSEEGEGGGVGEGVGEGEGAFRLTKGVHGGVWGCCGG